MTGLPILLDLAGRRVVIVGGGAVAARRAGSFAEAGADVLVIAPEVLPELAGAELAGHGIRLERRRYRTGDLADAWLAVAATDDPETNRAVAEEAVAGRVFCIRADRAGGGTARMPAVLRNGELTVSVNAGDDPRRATRLRDLIAAALETGELVSRPVRPATAGSVALVGGGPGDPELITVRGRRLLLEADVVVADRLAPRALLDALAPGVEVIDSGSSTPDLTQDEITAALVDRARQGRRVVRLTGGDPYAFGRGGEEVAACVAAGIDVRVVPGVSPAIAAPAAAGIPLTHRGLAADFAVVSGQRDPGATGPATLVVLMDVAGTVGSNSPAGLAGLAGIAAELIEHGRPADTPAAAIHRATLSGQRVVRAPLGGLAEAVRKAGTGVPSVVVIGAVAALGAD